MRRSASDLTLKCCVRGALQSKQPRSPPMSDSITRYEELLERDPVYCEKEGRHTLPKVENVNLLR